MTHIRLLAVISIDGNLSMDSGVSTWWLHPQKYGVDELKRTSALLVEEEMPLNRLLELGKETDGSLLIIANNENVGLVHELLCAKLIDEMVVFTMPVLSGTGTPLFQTYPSLSYWTVAECFAYPEHITKIVYQHSDDPEDI